VAVACRRARTDSGSPAFFKCLYAVPSALGPPSSFTLPSDATNRKKKSKNNSTRKKCSSLKQYLLGGCFGDVLKKFPRVFELPLQRNALKKKRTYVLFFRAGADVRRFPILFLLPPLGLVPPLRPQKYQGPGLNEKQVCVFTAFKPLLP
jgi:hypothetical protein